jgi:hypothetical protein
MMSDYFKVRFADNGVDRGYLYITRGLSADDAAETVMRMRKWANEDAKVTHTREILSVEPYVVPDTPYSEHNTCPGDVAARDSL